MVVWSFVDRSFFSLQVLSYHAAAPLEEASKLKVLRFLSGSVSYVIYQTQGSVFHQISKH